MTTTIYGMPKTKSELIEVTQKSYDEAVAIFVNAGAKCYETYQDDDTTVTFWKFKTGDSFVLQRSSLHWEVFENQKRGRNIDYALELLAEAVSRAKANEAAE